MKKLYHGSAVEGLKILQPLSPLHGNEDKNVVYLSGNRPYSLFYIWGEDRTGSSYKYVTCGLRDGIVHYEEQFEGQLKAFYHGVSGWMYELEKDDSYCAVPNREDMWYSEQEAFLQRAVFIPDVYEEIQKYILQGKIEVHQMDNAKKKMLFDWQLKEIQEKRLCEQPDSPLSRIYIKYFPEVWEAAKL